MTGAELAAKYPTTALLHGVERPGRCSCGCGASPLVLGTMLAADCYSAVLAAGLDTSSRTTSAGTERAAAVKALALRVIAAGPPGLSLLDVADTDDIIDRAARLGYVYERCGRLLGTAKTPSKVPTEVRATALMNVIKAEGRPVTYEEARVALRVGRAALSGIVKKARELGYVESTATGPTPSVLSLTS